MLTIGFPGFAAFAFYAIIYTAMMRLIAGFIIRRNPDSALAAALLFVS